MNRFEKLNNEKKKRIIDAAIKEFGENGYERASINVITKNANLRGGALYYYFENKLDLFETMVKIIMVEIDSILNGFDSVNSRDEFYMQIGKMIESRKNLNNKDYTDFIDELFLVKTDSSAYPVIEQLIHSKLSSIFELGSQLGYIRNDLPSDYLYNMYISMVTTSNKWKSNNKEKIVENELSFFRSILEG